MKTGITASKGHGKTQIFTQYLAAYFTNRGWNVRYEPVTYSTSRPVRADLEVYKPDGPRIFIECKLGDANNYVPLSAFTQVAQIAQSGPTVLYTNMKVPETLEKLFTDALIPVIVGPFKWDETAFASGLRKGMTINPHLAPLVDKA
jgi:hypothetical protein